MKTSSTNSSDELIEFFATCPKGFEHILADELKKLRVQRVRPLRSGVAFFGSKTDGYRVCLWSRVASRLLRVVARVDASDAQTLYRGVKQIAWHEFIAPHSTIALKARGSNASLRNSQFSALKVKDAICDSLREYRGNRPNISPHRPDVPIWVSIHNKKATISLDYAGESLHRRGYRAPHEAFEAPLKEALAAGMLLWGGWDIACSIPCQESNSQSEKKQELHNVIPLFIDPTCGSGTLVLEAAMVATDRAPGLSRDYWGFEGNADFDSEAFDSLLAEADDRFEAGLKRDVCILGSDIDPRAISIALGNACRAGLANVVEFVCSDIVKLPSVLSQFSIDVNSPGFIAFNPPYGIRLSKDNLAEFYQAASQGLSCLADSWRMCVITPDVFFDSAVGFSAERTLSVYNGAIESSLRAYRLGSSCKEKLPLVTLDGNDVSVMVSSNHTEQFASRFRKMLKTRRKWASKNDIHAYRVYDADLPDYAVTVDLFEEKDTHLLYALISEYQAPKKIDPQKAASRFMDACKVVQALCGISDDRVFTRVRRQDRGGSQYHKESHRSHAIIVEEAHLPIEIDLSGYLDTGLFLDHRITRALVGNLARSKRFLNLFAYTGVATLYVAAQGAKETTTVDMSKTYLEWACRNMNRCGFTGPEHHFVRADVLSWVEQQVRLISSSDSQSKRKSCKSDKQSYDVVFLDPPTFSNSKTMGSRTWDIQRDHVNLIGKVARLVSDGGVIVFSGNLRSFTLDEEGIRAFGLRVENITAKTIPEDFLRNPRIHFCYVLTKESKA